MRMRVWAGLDQLMRNHLSSAEGAVLFWLQVYIFSSADTIKINSLTMAM